MRPLTALGAEGARRLAGIVFDLDDTLLDHGELTEAGYGALFRLREAGLRLIACTGRPAGWGEVLARQWPVDAVVAENGAIALVAEGSPHGRQVTVIDPLPEAERRAARAQLVELAAELVARFPEAALADDNDARRTDVTLDVGEHRRVGAGGGPGHPRDRAGGRGADHGLQHPPAPDDRGRRQGERDAPPARRALRRGRDGGAVAVRLRGRQRERRGRLRGVPPVVRRRERAPPHARAHRPSPLPRPRPDGARVRRDRVSPRRAPGVRGRGPAPRSASPRARSGRSPRAIFQAGPDPRRRGFTSALELTTIAASSHRGLFARLMSFRSPAPGVLVDNKYRLAERIGGGGMGDVFRAENVLAGRAVAIKFLHPELAQNVEVGQRFFQEAQAVNRIRHANVVEVIDAGVGEMGPYIVMEYLDGESVGASLSRVSRFELDATVATVIPVLEALDAAHRVGIIHRDLKPENVFIARDATRGIVVRLLDFGIAKVLDGGPPGPRTRTGVVFGTPDYLSPEQATGEGPLDGRSDLFSVGVLMYELVTGLRPFRAPTAVATAFKVVHADAPSIASSGVHTDQRLEGVVHRLLQKDPARRFQTAPDVIRDLEKLCPDPARRAVALAKIIGAARRFGQPPGGPETDWLSAARGEIGSTRRITPDIAHLPTQVSRVSAVPEPPRPARRAEPLVRALRRRPAGRGRRQAPRAEQLAPARSAHRRAAEATATAGPRGHRDGTAPRRAERTAGSRARHPHAPLRAPVPVAPGRQVPRARPRALQRRPGDRRHVRRRGAGRARPPAPGSLRGGVPRRRHQRARRVRAGGGRRLHGSRASALLMRDPGRWREIGRLSVDGELHIVVRTLLRPALDVGPVIRRGVTTWARLFSFGVWRVGTTSGGKVMLTISEFDPAPQALRLWMVGVIEQIARRAVSAPTCAACSSRAGSRTSRPS